MNLNRKDKISLEFKKAEEFLEAAELLHRKKMYSPSVASAYYSSMHAATAAFLTVGLHGGRTEKFLSFRSALEKFSSRLDPFIKSLETCREEWRLHTMHDYTENESVLRLYQARDFIMDVRDFLRRTVRV